MNKYSKHEKEFEEKCKKEYPNAIEIEEIDPVNVYETESLLFQTESALDILAQLIGIVYRFTGVVTYTDNGDGLIDKIQVFCT